MEYRAFGTTSMYVPAVGMGTWSTFDVKGDSEYRARRAVVDAAIAAGTTLFDTSPMYGESPRVLARALEGRREGLIVADKVWTSSAREAKEQIHRALERFAGIVDIYQVHNLVAWREQLVLLDELRVRGAVRVVGATHYATAAFEELMSVMRTGRIQAVQIPYNAVNREVERDVLPLAAQLGLGVLIMEPLGTGTLVRKSPPASALERLRQFGVTTWAQALLKWILSDARVHCVLPATRHASHAMENAAAGSPPWFDDDTRAYVARLATQL